MSNDKPTAVTAMPNRAIAALPAVRLRNPYPDAVALAGGRTVGPGEVIEVPAIDGWRMTQSGIQETPDVPRIVIPRPGNAPLVPADDESAATLRIADQAEARRRAKWATLEVRGAGFLARCPRCRELLARISPDRRLTALTAKARHPKYPSHTRPSTSPDAEAGVFADGDGLLCRPCTTEFGLTGVHHTFQYPPRTIPDRR